MKIAISAGGASLDSPFEPRFGRVPGFILYDSDSKEVEYMDNTANMQLKQGAGIKTAQSIADRGAEVLITGKVGPKAMSVLEKRNMRIVEGSGQTVRQVLDNYSAETSVSGSASAGWDGHGGGTAKGPGAGGPGGGRGMGGGGRGRGPASGGQGKGGGARGRGPGSGGRGMGGGGGRGKGRAIPAGSARLAVAVPGPRP
ncbi:MAG: NifB/NifX family molybdenum-iron cluster-binding protein [Desulfohalobiaceae bacterium]|nr:NifB/NifX family molybdenum-iron cluster-binding protein [Desulfohalobiaceae bacterium]